MNYIDHINNFFNHKNEEIVVVTAISPRYDRLAQEHKNVDPDIKFFAFLDIDNLDSYINLPAVEIGDSVGQNTELIKGEFSKPPETSRWQFLPICQKFSIPKMNAKIHKILIHEFFPKAKYTVWIDGNIQVRTKSLRRLIENMGNNDIMLFRHYSRNCLYSEANECMVRLLDSKEKIFDQICRYTQEGYPQGNGLAECPVIIRRNNKKTVAFNYMWWDEIQKGSSRDQISFPYVQYKTKIKVGYLPGTILNNEFFGKVTWHYSK